MTALYMTSLSENAGKTMVSAGLGKYWLHKGKTVGYLKLLLREGQKPPENSDKDARFIKKIFNLPHPLEVISAVVGPQGEGIKQAYEAVSRDKDIVIVEGLALHDSQEIIKTLAAKVIVIHDYNSQLSASFADYLKQGNHLIGVVLNKIPSHKMEKWRNRIVNETTSLNIPVLGSIPEKRILMTLSIADLAETLQGKILNNIEKSEDLIEYFMMGSSTFDRGAAYYNRRNNKAVILWGERAGFRKAAISNLQLAALQTSIRCLVISSGSEPIPAVSQKAVEKQVPVISAPGSMLSLVTILENSMGRLKFGQEQKLLQLEETLSQNLNLKLISEELGLAG